MKLDRLAEASRSVALSIEVIPSDAVGEYWCFTENVYGIDEDRIRQGIFRNRSDLVSVLKKYCKEFGLPSNKFSAKQRTMEYPARGVVGKAVVIYTLGTSPDEDAVKEIASITYYRVGKVDLNKLVRRLLRIVQQDIRPYQSLAIVLAARKKFPDSPELQRLEQALKSSLGGTGEVR